MNLKSTRDAYGDILLKLGSNDNIVVIDADLSTSTQTNKFAKKYTNRFFNCGCAEQNLVGVSAGLAISGKTVFASTYAIFLTRAWEQIRNTITHDNLNVKLCVTHSGLTNNSDGSSHQCLEDLGIMKILSNMTVINPCDAIETEKIIENETKRNGPCYIRLNREKTPIITEEYYNENEYKLEKVVRLKEGDDVSIIATGTMAHKSIDTANILKKEKISAEVINVHTIKPIDKNSIIDTAKKTGKILTVEEHSIIGGLGSSISDILSENYPVRMKKMGINDKFGESSREYNELLEKHGLTINNMIDETKKLMKQK